MKSVTVTAANGGSAPTTLQVGGTVNLAASAVYEDGTTVPSPTVVWSSKDPTATISGKGVVTGVSAGTARINATVGNVTSSDLTLTVTKPPLGALTVTAEAATGGQTVAVSENVGTGMMRRYMVTDPTKKPSVGYDTVCTLEGGWSDLPANGLVTGAEGQIVTVVELTQQGAKARAKGEAVLPAPKADA